MSIKEFIDGLSKTVIKEVQNAIHEEISKCIDEAVEKSMKNIFIIGVAGSLVAIGAFLLLWGVASGIDKLFNMGGLAFIIFGIFGIMIGIIIYDKLKYTKKNK